MRILCLPSTLCWKSSWLAPVMDSLEAEGIAQWQNFCVVCLSMSPWVQSPVSHCSSKHLSNLYSLSTQSMRLATPVYFCQHFVLLILKLTKLIDFLKMLSKFNSHLCDQDSKDTDIGIPLTLFKKFRDPKGFLFEAVCLLCGNMPSIFV